MDIRATTYLNRPVSHSLPDLAGSGRFSRGLMYPADDSRIGEWADPSLPSYEQAVPPPQYEPYEDLHDMTQSLGIAYAMVHPQHREVLTLPQCLWDLLAYQSEVTEEQRNAFWGLLMQPNLEPIQVSGVLKFLNQVPSSALGQLVLDHVLTCPTTVAFHPSGNGRRIPHIRLPNNHFFRLMAGPYPELALEIFDIVHMMALFRMNAGFSEAAAMPAGPAKVQLRYRMVWWRSAWNAIQDQTLKIMAVQEEGEAGEKIHRLAEIYRLAIMDVLEPTQTMTTLMWAFWFHRVNTVRLLVQHIESRRATLPEPLEQLYAYIRQWAEVENNNNADDPLVQRTMHATIRTIYWVSFHSGIFFDQFPLGEDLLLQPVEQIRDRVVEIMVNKIEF
ncbi:hypothetical protein BJ085DRAFT_41033 [Dimargaris cristalligena]|uniref:Uncharacterized protein n=1 Tax=Dimargaris cristalligena TaxID=215637 RepID=A0A4P9ZK49_9FUNG|nr:hypothetical protein BJ085DRAFT_41033 [Dimargaris cristalligena]|eukprot:RKP33453.1 hypothetical protein BJ085DRAFT_41033 [Dimargaris cristalligena]